MPQDVGVRGDPEQLLAVLRASEPGLSSHTIAARAAIAAPWPGWVPGHVRLAFERTGASSPFPHQVAAAEAAWAGRNVAVATGTGSGKSLCFMLPIASRLADQGTPATALYLSPTKALARDQWRRWAELDLPGLAVAAYDGDTPTEERRWARAHADIVLTNPDMLHHGILPGHPAWSRFLRGLSFVVIDEFHTFRGVFGSHMAAVVRRLLRVAEHYGSRCVVMGASATVAEPGETLQRITGAPAVSVTRDESPRGAQTLAVLPPQPDGPGLTRRSALVLADLVADGARTLAFVRSRRAAESVARLAQERLDEALSVGRLAGPLRVAPYRAGYLPEERRDLEEQLRGGAVGGMVATSALELGVDVTGLDAVVVSGWPGTRSSFRQRIGRGGRGGRDSLAVFVPEDDPLDRFLALHPDAIMAEPERVVLNPDNPYVLGSHLCAAAAELPLRDDDATRWFGPQAVDLLAELGRRGWLRRRPTGWFWTRRERASDMADLRGAGGRAVAVVEVGTGRLVAWVDPAAADRTVHPGAVYTHLGVDFDVVGLDAEAGCVHVRPAVGRFSTQALADSSVRIAAEHRRVALPGGQLRVGEVVVTSRVTGFLRRRRDTGQIISREPLDLPERHLPTQAVWWTVPERALGRAGIDPAQVPGAAHAAEHAAIGLLPLLVECDRWDIGGLSTAHHPDTGECTVFVHDGQAGGSGISWSAAERAEAWLQRTWEAIAACPCESGCPGCVQSPKCGNGNEPLDKAAAIRLLSVLLHE